MPVTRNAFFEDNFSNRSLQRWKTQPSCVLYREGSPTIHCSKLEILRRKYKRVIEVYMCTTCDLSLFSEVDLERRWIVSNFGGPGVFRDGRVAAVREPVNFCTIRGDIMPRGAGGDSHRLKNRLFLTVCRKNETHSVCRKQEFKAQIFILCFVDLDMSA